MCTAVFKLNTQLEHHANYPSAMHILLSLVIEFLSKLKQFASSCGHWIMVCIILLYSNKKWGEIYFYTFFFMY